MSFDWGGFTGGIIGTLGAFGAAWYTIKKQERQTKPNFYKRKLTMASTIANYLGGMNTELIFDSFSLFGEAEEKVNELLNGLTKMLPEAIEAGFDLANIINDLTTDLEEIKLNIKKSNNINLIMDPEPLIKEYIVKVANQIENKRNDCLKIMENIKQDIRKKYSK